MDISSARLTALLREAMILAAVPSAKADPAKTALIKALVEPPAPSGVPLPPAAAPALQALLSAAAAKGQQMGSAEILQAYLALAEPGGETSAETEPAKVTAVKATPANDDAQRGLAMPLSSKADDDGGVAKPASLPWLALFAPAVSPPASRTSAAAKRGKATASFNDAAQPESRKQMRIGLMALAAGFLAMAIVGFVLLVLR